MSCSDHVEPARTRAPCRAPAHLAFLVAFACASSNAGAATIIVDSDDDDSPPSALCSLRSAVASANTDTAVAGCAAGNGIDTITFDRGIVDIVLFEGELVARGELRVGARVRVTIRRDADAPPARIFDVVGGDEPAKLSLDNIAVRDGHTTASSAAGRGAGIRSAGDVVLVDSLVAENRTDGDGARGGGIQAADAVTLTDSEVSDNTTAGESARGAGIWADSVMLTNSRLLRNIASGDGVYGGGAYAGSVFLTDSTVADNSANGITDTNGGGIFATESAVVTRSLITGNSTNTVSAGGGGIASIGAVQVLNSTVSGNTAYLGGGIAAPLLTIRNSTIADNISADGISGGVALLLVQGASQFYIGSSIVDGNPGDIGSPLGAATVEGSDNIVGNAAASVTLPNDTRDCDPALAPLADNGGPTWTHALEAASCAIDTGDNPLDFPNDQRGAPRTSGAATDVGAYETQSVAIFGDGFED